MLRCQYQLALGEGQGHFVVMPGSKIFSSHARTSSQSLRKKKEKFCSKFFWSAEKIFVNATRKFCRMIQRRNIEFKIEMISMSDGVSCEFLIQIYKHFRQRVLNRLLARTRLPTESNLKLILSDEN